MFKLEKRLAPFKKNLYVAAAMLLILIAYTVNLPNSETEKVVGVNTEEETEVGSSSLLNLPIDTIIPDQNDNTGVCPSYLVYYRGSNVNRVQPTVVPESPAPAPDPVIDPEPTMVYWDVPLSDEIQEFLTEECEATGTPVRLVLAMIWSESDFRASIISATDDYGLMQINTCNHGWLKEELGISNFLDAKDNIRAGIHMISALLEKYEEPHLALMAYNMGEGDSTCGAKRLWNQGIYSSEYSRKIVNRMDELSPKE